MKYIQKGIFIFSLLVVSVLISACNTDTKGEASVSLMNTSQTEKVDVINGSNELEKLRRDILSMDSVYDVAIVKGKKETIIAYKVKHLYRFRLKKIEKEINQKLEKKYPDENFVISSDLKIFLETNKLINKRKEKAITEEDANKELQKIIKLQKELT